MVFKMEKSRDFTIWCRVVQWLGLHHPMQGVADSMPGWGTRIPYALRQECQGIERRQGCDKFNEDFGDGPHQKRKKENLKK